MKIGPLDHKTVGPEPEKAEQAKLKRDRLETTRPNTDSSAIDERKRLAGLADQKNRIDAAWFERSSKSVSFSKTAYSREQIESGRLERVKKRIEDGFYDRKEIVEKIADKLIEKLDLEKDSSTDSI